MVPDVVSSPECLASEHYPNELNLPALVKLPSARPDFKLIHQVLPDSVRVLNDSDRVSSCPLKMHIGVAPVSHTKSLQVLIWESNLVLQMPTTFLIRRFVIRIRINNFSLILHKWT
jgi:hypothetical protein